MSKVHLIKALQKNGAMRTTTFEGTKQATRAAEQSQLRVLLNPMEHDFSYITVESRGRRSIVKVTREGKDALRIFGLKQLSKTEV
jgi:CTP-dependent riboflavin kinase